MIDVLDPDVRVTITADRIPTIFEETMRAGSLEPGFVMDELERAKRVDIEVAWNEPAKEPAVQWLPVRLAVQDMPTMLSAPVAEELETDFYVEYDEGPRFPKLARLCFWRRWTRR